jgi:sugar phosphate permease
VLQPDLQASASHTAACKLHERTCPIISWLQVPGYVLGSLLADTRLGRRLTAAFALVLGGVALLLTAAASAVLPADSAANVATALTLVGKLCAAAAFIQAYLFPAELFPTAIRGAAIGIGNVFGRLGTVGAPLAATASALVVS